MDHDVGTSRRMRPFMQSSKTKQWDQIFVIYTGNKGRTLKFQSYINHVANVCISLAVVHLLMAFTHKRPVGCMNWIHVSTGCSTDNSSFCPPVQWVDYELLPQEIAAELCGTRYSFWTRMINFWMQRTDARNIQTDALVSLEPVADLVCSELQNLKKAGASSDWKWLSAPSRAAASMTKGALS